MSSNNGVDAQRAGLESALRHGEGRFNPFVAARAKEDLARADERLAFGANHTVVALVGGTGSGKSTLFNALSGLEFADAGELRPTTERAAACTWGSDATEMLDFLGVSESRRIRKYSELTDEEPEFEGLVLLDLPDHDSISVTHSVQVSELIPLIDLLIWVVDPQKYADQALHEGYLRELKRRSASMLVVLNQVDTIPESGQDVIVSDLRALLERDGLSDVQVVAASALAETGLEPIRERIAEAVAGVSSTARTVSADLAGIADRLRPFVGDREPTVDEAAQRPVARKLAAASGIPAVTQSIREAGASARGQVLAKPEQPANATVTALRDSWVDHVKMGLPDAWAQEVADAVSEPERLRRASADAIGKVSLPSSSSSGGTGLMLLAVILVLAGLVCCVVGWPASGWIGRVVFLVAGVALGAWAWSAAKNLRINQAKSSASEYEDAVGAQLMGVVKTHLAEPVSSVLSSHRAVREGLDEARRVHN